MQLPPREMTNAVCVLSVLRCIEETGFIFYFLPTGMTGMYLQGFLSASGVSACLEMLRGAVWVAEYNLPGHH